MVRNVFLRIIGYAVALSFSLALGCGTGPKKTKPVAPAEPQISVYAGDSLIDVFKELGRRFDMAHPKAKVRFSFGDTHQLLAQIQDGAHVDVFAPDNPADMRAALDAGLIDADSHDTFAYDRLVLASPENAAITNLHDLKGKRVTLAKTSDMAGRYARNVLDALKNDSEFGPEFVAELERGFAPVQANAHEVLEKIKSGAADAGFVFQTDVGRDFSVLPLPGKFSPLASYPIGMLQTSNMQPEAKEFIAFVLSKDGQQVLHDYGFVIANEVQ